MSDRRAYYEPQKKLWGTSLGMPRELPWIRARECTSIPGSTSEIIADKVEQLVSSHLDCLMIDIGSNDLSKQVTLFIMSKSYKKCSKSIPEY